MSNMENLNNNTNIGDNDNKQINDGLLNESEIRERVNAFIDKNNLSIKNFAEYMEIESIKKYNPYIIEIESLDIQRSLNNTTVAGTPYKNPQGFAVGKSEIDLSAFPYDEAPSAFKNHTTEPKVILASVETVICDTCGGQGKIQCHTCNGHGELICGECNGSGQVTCPPPGLLFAGGCSGSGTQNCSRCGGRGCYDEYNSAAGRSISVTCRSCGGRGSQRCVKCGGSGIIKCGTCRGSGKVQCRTCNGHGYLVCSNCEGHGKLQSFYYFEDKYSSEYYSQLFKEKGKFTPKGDTKEIANKVIYNDLLFNKGNYNDDNVLKDIPEEYDEYVRDIFNKTDLRESGKSQLNDHLKTNVTVKQYEYIEVEYEYRDEDYLVIVDLQSDLVYINNLSKIESLLKQDEKMVQKLAKRSVFYPLQKKQIMKSNFFLMRIVSLVLWMDGKITPHEENLFNIFANSLEIAPNEKTALDLLFKENKVSLSDIELELRDFYEKELAAMIAWMAINVDEEVDQSEELFFTKFIAIVGIDEKRIPHIKKIAQRELRFLKKGDFNIARVRLEGKRDTSLTVIEGSLKKYPMRNILSGAGAFVATILLLIFPPYLFTFGSTSYDTITSIKKSIVDKDLNKAVRLEESFSKIHNNDVYNLQERLDIYTSILKTAVATNNKPIADKYYKVLSDLNLLNSAILSDVKFSQVITDYKKMKEEVK